MTERPNLIISEEAVAHLRRAFETWTGDNRDFGLACSALGRAILLITDGRADHIAMIEAGAQRQGAESARFFGQTLETAFEGAILEGRSFSDVLGGLLKTLERSALQAVFTGQGPLAGLLGTAPSASAGSNAVGGLASIFTGGGLLGSLGGSPVQGPTQSGATLYQAGGLGLLASLFGSAFRANGGPVSAGRPYTVGELGREMFVPRVDGQIVPIGRGGYGGGQSIDQSRSYSIDARGAQAGVADQITAALRVYDGQLNRTLNQRQEMARKAFD